MGGSIQIHNFAEVLYPRRDLLHVCDRQGVKTTKEGLTVRTGGGVKTTKERLTVRTGGVGDGGVGGGGGVKRQRRD